MSFGGGYCTLRIQYHDLRARIRAYMVGDRKKCVKKAQNTKNQALFGGGIVGTRLLQGEASQDVRKNGLRCEEPPGV